MKRKSFFAVLFVFFILIFAAGCGNHNHGDENTPTPVDVSAPAPTTPVADDGDDETLVVETYQIADYFPLTQENYWQYATTMYWEERYTVIEGGEVIEEWFYSEKEDEYEYYVVIDGTETIYGVETTRMSEYGGWDEYVSFWTSDDAAGMTLYGESEWWGDLEYSPPVNYLPGEVSIGLQNSLDSVAECTSCWGSLWEEKYSGVITVEGIEEVTMSAGVFETLKIVIVLDNPYGHDDNDECSFQDTISMWLAEGVGKVKEEKRTTETCRYEDEGDYEEDISTEIVTLDLIRYGNGLEDYEEDGLEDFLD